MRKRLLFTILSGMFLMLALFGSLYIFSFQLNGNKKIEVLYQADYIDLGYKTFLSLGNLVKTESNVDTSKIGTYQVIYKLPFKTLVREVKVVDKEKPEIILEGESNIEVNVGSTYSEIGYRAYDNVDLDISDKVKIENNVDTNKVGEYQIIYKVEDNSNNKNEVIRNVKVVDKVSPVITLKGSNKVVIKINSLYDEDGYIANDNVDGDITNLVKTEKNVDYGKIGTYYIKYFCSDTSGNYTEAIRTIEVIENVDITYIKGILLVNKKYHLPSNYNPGVNKEAYDALLRLQNDALSLGYSLPLLSGFRSYETQKYLFNDYASRNGYEKANTFSALPGQSEHQTGLAFDIGEISDNFGNTESGIWLAENAYKYGFIIRYLKGKENITGYKYEPWHVRYVGNVAEEIYINNLTLEEYLGVA